MTREQKLGLIIGFAVVLVFGVLIADHFSRARSEPLLSSDPVDEPLVIPRVGGLEPAARGSLPTLTEPLAGRVVEPGPGEVGPRGRGGAPATGSAGSPEIDLQSIFGPSADERVASGGESRSGVLPGFVRVGEDPAAAEPMPEPRAAEPEGPARVRTHRVREGETLYRIAERYYGNGHLWRRLATANASVVTADGQVSQDAVLRIPSPETISGATRSSGSATSGGTSGGVVVGTYTVQPGDTLSEISQRLLGTVRRMDDLIEMNRGLIRDADDIRIGMTLRYERGPEA